MKIMLLVLALLISSYTAQAQGRKAPLLSVEQFSGPGAESWSSATWESLRGKTIILGVWATWCGPCVAYMPEMNALVERYANQEDVAFLFVTNERLERIDQFRARRDIRGTVGHDLDGSLIQALAVKEWPTTFAIQDGVIIATLHGGELDSGIIESFLDGTYEQKNVPKKAAEQTESTRVMPGVDPLVGSHEDSVGQIIVRRADAKGSSTNAGANKITILGGTVREIVALVWGVSAGSVVGDKELLSERFDVIMSVDEDQVDNTRLVVASMLGVAVLQEKQIVEGYIATIDSDGILFEEAMSGGYSILETENGFLISGVSVPIEAVLSWAGDVLRMPMEDRTGLGGKAYFAAIEIPTEDADAVVRVLRKDAGIVLEEAMIDADVLVVEQIKQQ